MCDPDERMRAANAKRRFPSPRKDGRLRTGDVVERTSVRTQIKVSCPRKVKLRLNRWLPVQSLSVLRKKIYGETMPSPGMQSSAGLGTGIAHPVTSRQADKRTNAPASQPDVRQTNVAKRSKREMRRRWAGEGEARGSKKKGPFERGSWRGALGRITRQRVEMFQRKH